MTRPAFVRPHLGKQPTPVRPVRIASSLPAASALQERTNSQRAFDKRHCHPHDRWLSNAQPADGAFRRISSTRHFEPFRWLSVLASSGPRTASSRAAGMIADVQQRQPFRPPWSDPRDCCEDRQEDDSANHRSGWPALGAGPGPQLLRLRLRLLRSCSDCKMSARFAPATLEQGTRAGPQRHFRQFRPTDCLVARPPQAPVDAQSP